MTYHEKLSKLLSSMLNERVRIFEVMKMMEWKEFCQVSNILIISCFSLVIFSFITSSVFYQTNLDSTSRFVLSSFVVSNSSKRIPKTEYERIALRFKTRREILYKRCSQVEDPQLSNHYDNSVKTRFLYEKNHNFMVCLNAKARNLLFLFELRLHI